MKLKNVKVGMKVKVKSKHVSTKQEYSTAESSSLGRSGEVVEIDDRDFMYTVKVAFDDYGQDIDWMNHKQVRQLDKPVKLLNPKVGDSVYVTYKALQSGVPEHTVESVVTWTGDGYRCTEGGRWYCKDLSKYRKPKEGDRINSAPLSIETIKVGMKVRTLEGTLTDKFRFPVGTEFTVEIVGGDEKHVSLKHGSGTTQTDRIENLTKSW